MEKKYLSSLELEKIIDMAVMRAVCPETKEILVQEKPYKTNDDVRYLLAQTDAMAAKLLKNGNPHISSCLGASAAVNRTKKNGILSMSELLKVAGALRNFSVLASWFSKEEAEKETSIDDFFYSITQQPALEKDISEKILSDTEMADNASDELYQIRRKIRQAEGQIREKLDALIKNQNQSKYLQEAIVSLRNGRYVVPVKSEHRAEIGGVIHDVSSSGGTVFVEPTPVVEANAKIMQLKNQEQIEIDRILQLFSQQVAEMAPLFEASYSAMLEIDKRIAKAELGLSMNAVLPVVNDETFFSIVRARHPLLSKDLVVPIDIELGKDYDSLIITGPNTGGKTVSLKTAGLFCAMAQMGYLLPAHDTSSVCVFEKILVDIGDEQSIEQSLSTFSGHMKNITDILKVVNSKSLVLLDELGAGTDPAEGAALAIAIIEQLRMKNAKTMATTHYAELKMFALDTEGVQNASSEFNVETLRPTYRLIVGVPGRSNAFLIGEKLGIPQTVIERAREHLSSEQRRFETVLVQLEDAKLELKNKEEQINQLQYDATHQLEKAKEKRDELIKQGEIELEAARIKAKGLADEVQKKAYDLVDEMKRLEKDTRISNAQKAQRAREIARRDSEGLNKQASAGEISKRKDYVPLKEVFVGQEVWLPEMDKIGVVTAFANKLGLIEIRMGAIKTKVKIKELAAVPKMKKELKQPRQRKVAIINKTSIEERKPASEINLIGKTVDEALLDVDQFIDNAVMTGLETVYVIHGRGTGALRAAVGQQLRRNRSVKAFRLGRYGEGEDGVTVVEIK